MIYFLLTSFRINIFVRRLGGSYGAKISRSAYVSGATALASEKLRNPVRMWMNYSSNMEMMGKRMPCFVDYKVAVNKNGAIQYLQESITKCSYLMFSVLLSI